MEVVNNKEDLRKFIESFFNGLKCELAWDGKTLEIRKVPLEFETYYGKKSPYSLVFDEANENAELITKGSSLLKAITTYLESRGQTTLIRLNFERDYKEQFERYLKLRNCTLYSLIKKPDYRSILRFTFMTQMQYVNDKEQLINSIHVKDGSVINFILEKYSYTEGKREELPKKDIKSEYELAKEELKKILQKKTQETSEALKKRLDKEIERIRDHYRNQTKELDVQMGRNKEQTIALRKQMEKVNEIEKKTILAKIEKLHETMKGLENPEIKEKLNKEESFFINDEIHKHALNINNKLMNTTIIYYPVFTFTLVFKSKDSARQVELIYNPMEDTLTAVTCESCKREITELTLCSSGHVICQNCSDICRGCMGILCSSCTKKECSYCGIKMCKHCAIKCTKCLKTVCKLHMNKDYTSGKDYCINCLAKCFICNQFTLPAYMKKDSAGNNVCKKCLVLSTLKVR